MSDFNYYDYVGDNWDDSEVIDKLPLKEVIDEYRRVGKNEELIYGWCVWRRELEKYNRMKKEYGPVWAAEHAIQIVWNMEHDILQDCRENGLMDVWYFRQAIEKPWRKDFSDMEEVIDNLYKSLGPVEEPELPFTEEGREAMLETKVKENEKAKETEQSQARKRRGFLRH